jgi:hypothetical protein
VTGSSLQVDRYTPSPTQTSSLPTILLLEVSSRQRILNVSSRGGFSKYALLISQIQTISSTMVSIARSRDTDSLDHPIKIHLSVYRHLCRLRHLLSAVEVNCNALTSASERAGRSNNPGWFQITRDCAWAPTISQLSAVPCVGRRR